MSFRTVVLCFALMELQAVTGQLYIVDGVIADGTAVPGLLAQPAPSRAARGRARDFLFVHLTLTGTVDETADLTQKLLNTISQNFYAASGSVTAALRGAIINANQFLLRHNLSQAASAHEGAITCAVLRQGELFTLQTGESLALLGHNFGIERIPATPPEHITPLGRSSGLDIRYFHHRLQTGDTLLLADPRISPLATETFTPALVDTPIEIGLEKLAGIIGEDSTRLMLVEFSEDVPLDMPDASQPSPREGQFVAPVPQPRRALENLQTITTAERRPQPRRRVTTRQQPLVLEEEPAQPTLPSIDLVAVETTARRASSRAALGLSVFMTWLVKLLTRLRPPHSEQGEEEPVNWTWPIIFAVVIPLLVAIIVTGVYLERGQVQRLADIKAEMELNIGLAEQAGDDIALARYYYESTLALAKTAETEIDPGDEKVARLRDEAREHLDELDGITRFKATLFYEYSEGTELTAVVLREGFNGGIYTLDKGNGYVYEHDTDESYLKPLSPEPLQRLFRGQAFGNHSAGDIVDIMWRPQGSAVSQEGLAMLDSNGALLTFQPSFANTSVAPLDLSSNWQAPLAMTTYDERLYILDIGAREIWKYFPEGNGFIAIADERTLELEQELELALATDIDIYSEDGSLIIIYRDGRIRYYDTRSSRIQWDETDLLKNGLTSPLISPTAVKIVGRGPTASIYIADAGSGRIIWVSRPTGQVLAQFRATGPNGEELFSNLTGFDIAESPLRIFLTTRNALYVAQQE